MREFKFTRVNGFSKNTFVDHNMFTSYEKAEAWMNAENEKRPGAVLEMTEVTEHTHSELKHEY